MKKITKAMLSILIIMGLVGCSQQPQEEVKKEEEDVASTATSDADTSASIVPKELIQTFEGSKEFTDSDAKKVMLVVGDPRDYSVLWDMVNTAGALFTEKGYEVVVRDLYEIQFNPVLSADEFYYAKDGAGEPSKEIALEQSFVEKADHIIFAYPNWHDTPNAIVKGYMEKVFAKEFAYTNGAEGLEGLLKGKDIYTIMNAGFLGGGQGDLGDGVGIDDKAWDEYMGAFKVLDDDTADFWGVENRGRFINDRTPANTSENYESEINELRDVLKNALVKDFNLK